MLDRACEAEGSLESTLVRLACERSLGARDVELLGRFRQLYQRLRESIRDDRPLAWDHAEHPEYVAFKTLAPQVAALIVGRDAAIANRGDRSTALLDITSNRWVLPPRNR